MKKGNAQQRRPLQVTRCRLVFLGYFEIQLEGREAADNDVLVQTGGNGADAVCIKSKGRSGTPWPTGPLRVRNPRSENRGLKQ